MRKEIIKLKEAVVFFLLVVTLIICFLLVKPFIVPIFSGFALGYVFYPLYKLLLKGLKNKTLTSLVVLVIALIIIFVPLIFILKSISTEAYYIFVTAKQKLLAESFMPECEKQKTFSCKIINPINALYKNALIKSQLLSAVQKLSEKLISYSLSFIFSIPRLLLDLFITFFTMFYILRDGDIITNKLVNAIKFKKISNLEIKKIFDDVTYATVYGNVLVAIIQGIVAGIGYFIFGIKSPIIWGAATIIGAFIPVIGTGIIWGPLSIVQIFNGLILSNPSMVARGIGLFLYGMFIVGTIDNIIRPVIISGKAPHIHPLLVLISILGGLAIFGIAGLIVGPLIFALLIALIKIIYVEYSS